MLNFESQSSFIRIQLLLVTYSSLVRHAYTLMLHFCRILMFVHQRASLMLASAWKLLLFRELWEPYILHKAHNYSEE
uniref:Uncharacterized protein n=1 Tax=Triticum urartu TaxID=4572 RepID=A0A8R7UBY7_TRIUA